MVLGRQIPPDVPFRQRPIAVVPVLQKVRSADRSERSTLTCYLPFSKVGTFAAFTRLWEFWDTRGAPRSFLTQGLSRQYPSACIGGIQVWPLFVAVVMAVKRCMGYKARKYCTGQGPYHPVVDEEGTWVPLLNVIVEYLLEPSNFSKAGDKLFVAKFMPHHVSSV